jgi:hypothetical protein
MNQTAQNWKTQTILIGTLVGAVAGAAAALILVQQAEKKNARPKLNAGEGVKLGLGILGLLRLVSDITNVK